MDESAMDKPNTLPQLRDDLQLYPLIEEGDEDPKWMIFDPISNQYFDISWMAFELLIRFNIRDPDILLEITKQETSLEPTEKDLATLLQFLQFNGLLQQTTPATQPVCPTPTKDSEEAGRRETRFLAQYPLGRPDFFLEKTLPLIRVCFSKTVFVLYLLIGLLCFYTLTNSWDSFFAALPTFINSGGLGYCLGALILIHCCQQLAIAYTIKYYGCHVKHVGIALYYCFPVLYFEPTNSWMLEAKSKRLVILGAGMIVGSALAFIATLLWQVMPSGLMQNLCYSLAITAWFHLLAVQLNPCIRFDGYRLLAEQLNIPDLQTKALATIRWSASEICFRFGEPPPLASTPSVKRILISLGLGTIFFRLLIVGFIIACGFYYSTLLGMTLLLIALCFGLLLPFVKIILFLISKRRLLHFNVNTMLTSACIAALLFILIHPWQTSLYVPAVLEYQDDIKVTAPMSAQVKAIHIQEGDHISSDQLLVELRSPELETAIAQNKLDLEIMSRQLKQQSLLAKEAITGALDQVELQRTLNTTTKLANQLKQLTIKSPKAGDVIYLNHSITPGCWITQGTLLTEMLNRQNLHIKTIIEQNRLSRVLEAQDAVFYPENEEYHPRLARVWQHHPLSPSAIINPYLLPMSEQPLYEVELIPAMESTALPFVRRGHLKIASKARSLLAIGWEYILATLIPEPRSEQRVNLS